jgi:hypothetical protein
VDQEDRDRIAEHLVEVFELYKLLSERRAALAHDGLQEERAQVDKAIKSAVADFAETSYPLACNSALRWWSLAEPQELANEVMAQRLLPRAENIMQFGADVPIALVQQHINWAISDILGKAHTRATREDNLIKLLGHRDTRNTTANTDEIALANLDWNEFRKEFVSHFRKEFGLIETDLVSGEDVCVFHPGQNNSLDHQLVAEVLQENLPPLDLANRQDFEQYIQDLHDEIRLRVSVKNTITLSRRWYRCLDCFLYRLFRSTDSAYRYYAAERLAGYVKLEGDRDRVKAAWNRQSCQRQAARVLWRECPDVKDRIANYLADKRANGLSDGDVRRLIAELED